MKIIDFDVLSASEELWAAYFRHMDAICLEMDPEEPLLPHAKSRSIAVSLESNPYRRLHRFLLLPGDGSGEAAGFALAAAELPASPSYAANRHSCNLKLSVLPAYRRKGLGTRLLKHVVSEMTGREPALTEFLSPVVLAPGQRFMEKHGGTVSLETAENRLYLKDADWGTVEAWAADGARANPGTEILTVSRIPQEDIADYAEAYTEAMNQQPFGDIDVKIKYTPEMIRFAEAKDAENGGVHTTIYSRESGGRVSGLTETAYQAETGHRVTQYLTGVRLPYRGRGLGKLLKARMMLHIRKEYPGVKYIATGNADSNAPMLAINNKLGFKKHLPVKIYKYKISGHS